MPKVWVYPFLLLSLILSGAFARADDSPEWTQCTERPSVTTNNDAVIAGCTSVLDAAKEPPHRLAVAVFDRGVAYYREGQYDKAEADNEAALRYDPKYAMAYVARGYHEIGQDKFDAAVQDFGKAAAIDPKLVEAYYGRGLAYGAAGKIDSSIKDHQKAIELNPQYASAYFGLGLEYRDKGQLDRAIASFDKAIEIDPKYAQALYNRGYVYGMQKKLDRAVADYSAAIEIDPHYAKALLMRGLAYRDTGKTERALADLDAAARADPKFAPAVQARDELREKLAQAAPEPSGQDEDTVFALYLARAGNLSCNFGIDDEEKAALEREVADRMQKASISADRAKQLAMRAESVVATQKAKDAKFCAPDGEFAGQAREMFDAVADRPKRSQ